ncbi:MAG: hypothetical protein JNL72_04625 [Flavipsychrobacter sp.]|nr:hypothetical protein [Flavipsychrobacter sp.]
MSGCDCDCDLDDYNVTPGIDIPALEAALLRQVPLVPNRFKKTGEVFSMCMEAHTTFHQGHFHKAIQLYSDILDVHYVSEACMGMAISYYFLGDYNKAEWALNMFTSDLYIDSNTDNLTSLLLERAKEKCKSTGPRRTR